MLINQGDQENDVLHPDLEILRLFIVAHHQKDIDSLFADNGNELRKAINWALADAVDCFVVRLNDIGRRYLIAGKALLDCVFRDGVQPMFGANPAMCLESNDDENLDRLWAIAHDTQYMIDVLLGDNAPGDLVHVVRHYDSLFMSTKGLRGRIAGVGRKILCDYIRAGILVGDATVPLERAKSWLGKPVTPRTKIQSFKQINSQLRMVWMVGKYAMGDQEYYEASREALKLLLQKLQDHETRGDELGPWASRLYALPWAWLWECVFRDSPDVDRAIGVIRGTVAVDG